MDVHNVALEGLSFSGKSSAIAWLRSNGSFRVIPELSDFHSGGSGFPAEDLNKLSSDEVDEWFLQAEVNRCNHAREISADNQVSSIILDRSFLSIAIHAVVTSKMAGKKEQPLILEKIKKSITNGNLINSHFLYLKIDLKTHDKRSTDHFQELMALGKINQFEEFRLNRYDRQRIEMEYNIYNAIFSKSPLTVIDANRDRKMVQRQIEEKVVQKVDATTDARWVIDELQNLL